MMLVTFCSGVVLIRLCCSMFAFRKLGFVCVVEIWFVSFFPCCCTLGLVCVCFVVY